jgi:hypothetical protein
MTRCRSTIVFVSLLLLFPAVVASAAGGDGLPIGGLEAGPEGVTNSGEGVRYVTLPAAGGTVVARIQKKGGQLLGSRQLRARFSLPVVALDGSAAGLSRNGRTLVLIHPRRAFPQSRTRLAVIDPRSLRTRRLLSLGGDFSFDAVDPTGRLVYLIQYLSRRDPTRYAVRAYDLRASRLLPDPIIDRREPDEQMRGMPITRTNSADGRWAYTLYDGAGKHPFVHALDTVRGTAACIDLDALAQHRRLYGLRLALTPAGERLTVVDRGTPAVLIDTRSFRVSAPVAPADRADGGISWAMLGLGGAGLLAIAAFSLRLRRRRRLAPT